MMRMTEFHSTDDLASWWGRRVKTGLTDLLSPSTAIMASTAYGVQHRMKEPARRRTLDNSWSH